MPIYEYQCNACGHTLEALQKISEAVLTDCPACTKPALQKLVSATSFQLKGTGWYATDFKTKTDSKPKTESSSAETSSASTTSETKPASTTSTTDKDGK